MKFAHKQEIHSKGWDRRQIENQSNGHLKNCPDYLLPRYFSKSLLTNKQKQRAPAGTHHFRLCSTTKIQTHQTKEHDTNETKHNIPKQSSKKKTNLNVSSKGKVNKLFKRSHMTLTLGKYFCFK